MGHVLSPLYAVVDTAVARRAGWNPVDVGRAVLAGGGQLLQVRAKTESGRECLAIAEAIVRVAEPYHALVLVNDRADIARLAGAGGVHVGQDDLTPAQIRQVVDRALVVGLSTHTPAQVTAGGEEPVDYLAIGPVFATGTKDTGYAAIGLDAVRRSVELAGGLPLVAIGGITLARAAALLEAGATSVAVISDLFATGDPERRTREYLEHMTGGH